MNREFCEYCQSFSWNDVRGNCICCGAPRSLSFTNRNRIISGNRYCGVTGSPNGLEYIDKIDVTFQVAITEGF